MRTQTQDKIDYNPTCKQHLYNVACQPRTEEKQVYNA